MTILGWYTKYDGEKVMFVTSQADDATITRSKPKQAYQASPFEEERKAFADQVKYLKSMYYHGLVADVARFYPDSRGLCQLLSCLLFVASLCFA